MLLSLQGISFPNGTYVNVTNELNNLTQTVSRSFKPDAVGINQTSDPYYLALAIAVLRYHTPSQVAVNQYAAELIRLQNASGCFVPPPARASSSYTAFNQIGRDRLIETTSLAVIALVRLNNTDYAANIKKATAWLRTQARGDGEFGGSQATTAAYKALLATSSSSGMSSGMNSN